MGEHLGIYSVIIEFKHAANAVKLHFTAHELANDVVGTWKNYEALLLERSRAVELYDNDDTGTENTPPPYPQSVFTFEGICDTADRAERSVTVDLSGVAWMSLAKEY